MSHRPTLWRYSIGTDSFSADGITNHSFNLNSQGDTSGWTLTRMVGRVGVYGFGDSASVRSGNVIWGINQQQGRDPLVSANSNPGEWLAWGMLALHRDTGDPLIPVLRESIGSPQSVMEFDVRGQHITTNGVQPVINFRAVSTLVTWTQVTFWWHVRCLYIQPL